MPSPLSSYTMKGSSRLHALDLEPTRSSRYTRLTSMPPKMAAPFTISLGAPDAA